MAQSQVDGWKPESVIVTPHEVLSWWTIVQVPTSTEGGWTSPRVDAPHFTSSPKVPSMGGQHTPTGLVRCHRATPNHPHSRHVVSQSAPMNHPPLPSCQSIIMQLLLALAMPPNVHASVQIADLLRCILQMTSPPLPIQLGFRGNSISWRRFTSGNFVSYAFCLPLTIPVLILTQRARK